MASADFARRIRELRGIYEDFADVLNAEVVRGEDVGPFVPSQDKDFWQTLNRIEAAGHRHDASEAAWLASLTQVDDLGPNGRALFLATAALAALEQMPKAALTEGMALFRQLSSEASIYRKVGVGKVLEASNSEEAMPFLQMLSQDSNSYVQREIEGCLKNLRSAVDGASSAHDLPT